jgi:hypothetical protein
MTLLGYIPIPTFCSYHGQTPIPADQHQQFAAASWTQEISRASRVVIVLKPEKVVSQVWAAPYH